MPHAPEVPGHGDARKHEGETAQAQVPPQREPVEEDQQRPARTTRAWSARPPRAHAGRGRVTHAGIAWAVRPSLRQGSPQRGRWNLSGLARPTAESSRSQDASAMARSSASYS